MAIDTTGWTEADASGLWPVDRGVRWYRCDRCGFLFPSTDVQVEPHTGLRTCTTGPNCHDEQSKNDPALLKLYQQLIFLTDEEVTE